MRLQGQFEANILLNMTSPYWTTREALTHMREAGFGRIVFIGSGYAKRVRARNIDLE